MAIKKNQKDSFQAASKNRKKANKRLMLALQGGGSKGAFTAGFLHTLLGALNDEHPNLKDLDITAITGTSAGALNGTILSYALNTGEYEKGQKIFEDMYREVSRFHVQLSWPNNDFIADSYRWPNIPDNIVAQIKANRGHMTAWHDLLGPLADFWEASSGIKMADLTGKNIYQNILRRLLKKHIPDWTPIKEGATKLFINTFRKHKKTGEEESYIYPQEELRAAYIVSSASLFGPFEFDDFDHHDGAIIANPDLDMIEDVNPTDILTVSLYPENIIDTRAVHQSKANGTHPHSMKGSELHNHLMWLKEQKNRSYKLHHVGLPHDPHWNESCALNTDPQFLSLLWKRGVKAAERWLEEDAPKLNKKDTYNPSLASSPKARITVAERRFA